MTDIEIIKLVFGILLGIGGLVLVVLAFLIGYKYLVQESRCTARIRGTVIRYTRAYYGGEDSGVHLPVVSYAVDGEEYTVTGPKYKAYVTHTRRSPLTENRMEFEEKGQVFRVYNYINSVAGRYYNPMEELYPLHSQLEVYYDPDHPKCAYVLRYCNNKWIFWLLFLMGLLMWAGDVAIQIVLV